MKVDEMLEIIKILTIILLIWVIFMAVYSLKDDLNDFCNLKGMEVVEKNCGFGCWEYYCMDKTGTLNEIIKINDKWRFKEYEPTNRNLINEEVTTLK